ELDELNAARAIPRLRAAAWLDKGYLFLCAGDIENAERAIRVGCDDPAWTELSGFELHAQDIEAPEVLRIRFLIAQGDFCLAARITEATLDKAKKGRRTRCCL